MREVGVNAGADQVQLDGADLERDARELSSGLRGLCAVVGRLDGAGAFLPVEATDDLVDAMDGAVKALARRRAALRVERFERTRDVKRCVRDLEQA
jgi:hypothetical protein